MATLTSHALCCLQGGNVPHAAGEIKHSLILRSKLERTSDSGDSDNNNNTGEEGAEEVEDEDDEYDEEFMPEWHEDYEEDDIDEDDFFSDDDESENLERGFSPFD